ncbi:MAG: alanine racemase [Bdellovibrionales bacterium]
MNTSPFVRIDLGAIKANYAALRTLAPRTEIAGVVKTDSYGLGAATIAPVLYEAGCRTFFTAHFEEALALRKTIPDGTIIPLNGLTPDTFDEALAHAITPMLNHLGAIHDWATFARQKGRPLPALIHIDTGMNRLGLPQDELDILAADHALLDGINVLAWISHFARSEEFDSPMTPQQRDRMIQAVARLPKARVSLCNSSGLYWGPEYQFDLARPGIALYGGNPTPNKPNPLQNVVELCAPILQIHNAPQGTTVGYGATFTLTRPSRIAVLAMGYADGYRRSLRNQGTALIDGHPAPVIGGISMDLITLDVTDIPERALTLGAPATLYGPHRPIDQAATEAGTISYELLTALGPRVQRIYAGPQRA